ncbi:MAG: alpha-glucosidase C-terminal domain-containing protein [Caldilineales bacterium]|nr:alpha-glucosidase C-terminal domain-containing protein [Caldilineales bacterium]
MTAQASGVRRQASGELLTPDFGSRNCQACFAETGRARSLNRRKFDRAALLCSVNVSAQAAVLAASGLPPAPAWRDLLSGEQVAAANGHLAVAMAPYQARWLQPVAAS